MTDSERIMELLVAQPTPELMNAFKRILVQAETRRDTLDRIAEIFGVEATGITLVPAIKGRYVALRADYEAVARQYDAQTTELNRKSQQVRDLIAINAELRVSHTGWFKKVIHSVQNLFRK